MSNQLTDPVDIAKLHGGVRRIAAERKKIWTFAHRTLGECNEVIHQSQAATGDPAVDFPEAIPGAAAKCAPADAASFAGLATDIRREQSEVLAARREIEILMQQVSAAEEEIRHKQLFRRTSMAVAGVVLVALLAYMILT